VSKTGEGWKKFGPYEGSEKNKGRKTYVFKKKIAGKWVSSTSDKARVDHEERTGKKLRKDQEVDHKDNNRNNDSKGNLRVTSKSKNVAKENKRRAGKKETDK